MPTIADDGRLPEAHPHHTVSFREAVGVWSRVAALSFGGPAGQIAVMHRIVVEEKRWLGEERFLHALNYCMLLPGPEAQQLAIYIGWLMHRTRGGGGGGRGGGVGGGAPPTKQDVGFGAAGALSRSCSLCAASPAFTTCGR